MNAVAEQHRLIGNLLMLGVVAELDEAAARVRVDLDGMRSDWIPWVTERAGAGVRSWNAPEVGEQVIVASPYGDPAQGVVLGSIFQDAHPAPGERSSVHRTEYADGTRIEYDRRERRLTIDVGEGQVMVRCRSAHVEASRGVDLRTPAVRCSGSLSTVGNLAAGTGASGTFTTASGNIVTVQQGIVTNIF